jgi:hypothetical protein
MGENKAGKDIARMRLRIIMTIAFVLVALLGSGCSYMEFWKKKRDLQSEVKSNPSAALQRELTPEDVIAVYGRFEGLGDRKEPLLIIAVSRENGKPEIAAKRTLYAPQAGYAVSLLKGVYDVFVVADLDGNGFYDQNEIVGRTPEQSPVKVSLDKKSNEVSMDGPVIMLDFGKPVELGLSLHVKKRTSGLIYSSLDDEFFDEKYGIMGLWDTKGFMEHTQGLFFGLEEFDPTKTIVIFVHGVTGTPRDWKFIVDKLDRKRFQPWFYYYPSAMPLDKLGSHLATVVQAADALSKGKLERVVIVAHSMGGLIARAAVNELVRDKTSHYLKLYVSFSTPYGGHDAAKSGIQYAPVIVPSWIDMVPDSKLLVHLHEQKLPANVPFHLFFGFNESDGRKGECSDSTITLRSQLDPRAQAVAVNVYGYDDTHTGILKDAAVIKKINGILDSVASQKGH